MKICSRCKTERPLSDFNRNNTKSDGLSTMCKCCNKEYQKKRYIENSTSHKEAVRAGKSKYLNRNRDFIRKHLTEHPCVDCGFSDIRALQFDHVEMVGSKAKRVTSYMGGSLDVLKKEIGKCQVRCANCHFIRTRGQMGWDWL